MAPRTRSDSPFDADDPALPLKRQARRRLLGAFVLAIGVAIGFALFFDAEPRPALDDIQVRIPARDSPLPDRGDGQVGAVPRGEAPAAASRPAEVAAVVPAPAPVESAPPASAGGSGDARRESPVAEEVSPAVAGVASAATSTSASAAASAAAAAAAASTATPAPSKAAVAAEAPVPAKPAPSSDTRPEVKASGTEVPRAQGYFLQVGAFASEKAARDQVERIRRLGATAFTERIRTQQGERIRVRLGPFATRDASDALRQKLRAAGIDVTLVSP